MSTMTGGGSGGAGAASSSRKKIVYFCRHAEALHNVKEREAVQRAIAGGELSKAGQDEARRAVLREDKSLKDAPLSVNGAAQARDSGKKLESLFGSSCDGRTTGDRNAVFRRPDVVLVSPLRRALMTATELFHQNSSNDGAEPPLFLAVEALREKRTGLECDERSAVVDLRQEFPHVDFTDVERGVTVVPAGEDNAAVRARAASYMEERLPHVEATHVAIVTHKGWLREIRKNIKGRVDAGDLRADFDLNEWEKCLYGNAEVRVAAFRYEPSEDSERHPGGMELTSVVSRSVDNAILASTAMMGDGFEFALGPPSSGFSIFLADRTTKVHFISVSEARHHVAVRESREALLERSLLGEEEGGTGNGGVGGGGGLDAESFLLRESGAPASDHPLHDARLTAKGAKQARALRNLLASRPSGGRPFTAFDLVVTSPLTRALETAEIVFSDSPGEYGGGPVPPPRVLVREECRERHGRYVCDGRRAVSELREDFPAIDFSEMGSGSDVEDEDAAFADERETQQSCRERALGLLEWLSSRPEKCVAVVTHTEFLRHLFMQFGDNLNQADRSFLQRRAANCELRSVVLCSHGRVGRDASDAPASTVRVPSVSSMGSFSPMAELAENREC